MALSDRITEDQDWRDGMNAFRLKVLETLTEFNEEIKIIKKQIKEKTP